MIFVDANVLSLLFRRNTVPEYVRPLSHRLRWLISEQRIAIPGLVAQEVLSGIRHQEQFDRLCDVFRGLPIVQSTLSQHMAAAQVANQCFAKGVAVHVTDTMLAALALEVNGWVLTEDPDFIHMSKCCAVRTLSIADALRMTQD